MALLAAATRASRSFGVENTSVGEQANLSYRELDLLGAAMDEIIPKSDGMPSATEAGGVEYLQRLGWQYPSIEDELHQFLITLNSAVSATFRGKFRELQPDQRNQILRDLEKNQSSAFANFVAYVYEAYYTQPRVLGLLSCPASPTPVSEEELNTLLAPVRNMKDIFREDR
jgi:hypothetical protein